MHRAQEVSGFAGFCWPWFRLDLLLFPRRRRRRRLSARIFLLRSQGFSFAARHARILCWHLQKMATVLQLEPLCFVLLRHLWGLSLLFLRRAGTRTAVLPTT